MLSWQMCGFIFQIWAQWIDSMKQLIKHLFIHFLLLFCISSWASQPEGHYYKAILFQQWMFIVLAGF